MSSIHPSTLNFLKELSKNNTREWFNTNKSKYVQANENVCAFADEMIQKMNAHDVIEESSGKKAMYRIYKDVRFSKDKSPYNPRFAFGLSRATKLRRGGYYMHIQPGNSFLACGFFAPNPEDLKRIREDIAFNFKTWYKILHAKGIKTNFGVLEGEKVLTAPRGFHKDQEGIELIRHKQFILKHDFKDSEVCSKDFLNQANKIYKSVRPYFDYMTEILTTDANGESLL